MKRVYVLLILIAMTQTISCKEKTVKDGNHFRIEGTEIFYNESKVILGMPLEDFIKAINSEYRIAKYSIHGKRTKIYYWISKKIHVTESNDYFNIKGLEIDEKTGEFSPNWRDDAPEFPKFKSLDEVIKEYGKYDSLKVEEVPTQESVFYVFDKLGFNVAIDENTNTISQINIYPIHYTKSHKEYRLMDMKKGALIVSETSELSSIQYVEPDEKWKVENYQVMLERHPKTEFKGKFTYNGNTSDFSKLNYTDWYKAVTDLKISGNDYDPPGDSKGWSRQIRADYDVCMVDFHRYSNKEKGIGLPSSKKVGNIDFIESIEIWRSTDEDRK